MSCLETEEQLWIYDELSADQKKLVNQHIHTCADCKLVWDDVQQFKKTTAVWESEVNTPEHAAKLTHKIMDAIGGDRRDQRSLFSWIDSINTRGMRYGMATASLILLMIFLYDQRFRNTSSTVVPQGTVALTSSAFLKDRLRAVKSDELKFSLLACFENKYCPPIIAQKKENYENH